MISAKTFIDQLRTRGFNFFTGVPCSFFDPVIRGLVQDGKSSYYIAPNEGSALALATGALLGGGSAVLMIQNSGLGNLINPLTSLNLIYKIPILIFVSGRAYGVPDEPQHQIMGAKMKVLLDTLGIWSQDLPTDESLLHGALDEAIRRLGKDRVPVVFFVRKDTFASDTPIQPEERVPRFTMKRIDAIKVILELISEADLIFSTTGKISRELFFLDDRRRNFYMQGSMGHIGSIALGAALSKPCERVIVLDGDGACLMHLGAMPMIGRYAPERFYHLLLDNESYETTGDQDTLSPSVNFEAVADACGYLKTQRVETEQELRSMLPEILRRRGPALVRIKVNRKETSNIPRITTKHKAPAIADTFRQSIRSLVAKPAGIASD